MITGDLHDHEREGTHPGRLTHPRRRPPRTPRVRPSSILAALTTVVAVGATVVAVQSSGPAEPSAAGHGHGAATEAPVSGPAPEDLLLRAEDLPAGWRVPIGGGSGVYDGSQGPATTGVCGPLTALVGAHGTHSSGHGEEHGAARAVFTRSHFGPDLTQVVVDLGTEEAAEAELAELTSATGECDVLTRQGDGHSATIDFAVQPADGGPDVLAATLTAQGTDFAGVRQELRVVRAGSVLVALTYATQTGAEATELDAALATAVARASA